MIFPCNSSSIEVSLLYVLENPGLVSVCVISRHQRIMPAEKLAEFGTFSGTFHACLVCASSPLSNFFNKNTVKVSYSCMPNMACLIRGHNQKVLAPAYVRKPVEECNYRAKPSCPLDGRCLQVRVVYQANVTARSSGDEN